MLSDMILFIYPLYILYHGKNVDDVCFNILCRYNRKKLKKKLLYFQTDCIKNCTIFTIDVI